MRSKGDKFAYSQKIITVRKAPPLSKKGTPILQRICTLCRHLSEELQAVLSAKQAKLSEIKEQKQREADEMVKHYKI